MEALRLLALPQVQSRISGCKSQIYGLINEGLLTPPVKLGRKSVWPDHEVDAIVTARVGGASEDQIRTLVTRLMAARKRRFDALMQEAA